MSLVPRRPALSFLLLVAVLSIAGQAHGFQSHGAPKRLRAMQQDRATADIFTLIPGRYPKAVSLPDVLSDIPDSPGGRAFVKEIADYLYSHFGIFVPDSIVDLFFEDSSVLLNYLQFSAGELFDGTAFLNFAYQHGWINGSAAGHVDVLPNGFDLAHSLDFPLNLSNYMPGPPVQIAPNLWKGFYPGSAPKATIKAEIVLSLALNQLSNNSHKPDNDPTLFSVVYNNRSYTEVEDLFNAFLENDHTIESYLTWRAVDFFGLLTKTADGQWREVPAPIMLDTGVYDPVTGKQAILPAIHDEVAFVIRSGPNTKGYAFDGDLLWYEGDDGIGFFARDLYDLASWVGDRNADKIAGSDAARYAGLAGLFSDALLLVAQNENLYDNGYGATGVCVDSIAVIEWIRFGEMTLYPLLMETYVVTPTLKQLVAMNNRHAEDYKKLLAGVQHITPDIFDNPTLKFRANNTITWPVGQEPFQVVVDARSILN